ncbi:MAG: NADH-quinone oxidoreductase subunit G [Actinobacteria bacterium 69-20]|nr:NADH-quinone oxidoreductase subunit G [Actinomycetota bacterium]OJV26649.1 MAG: NADH-quinone oxidoreductase subunit G [Actinobacteria bacterium 69-20]
MTATLPATETPAILGPAWDADAPAPDGYVKFVIDGQDVIAPKGEMVIRTCERMGIEITRFCDHPLLEPIAACRQCLVEMEMGGRKMPKPQPACAVAVADGLVVHTQRTSEVAARAQWANVEFILTNHPLDCPMCDKGGECPLQNQDLAHGPGESRFKEAKRTFVKPIAISTEILLDRDRCILCYRCTRFSEEIAGDPFIDMLGRGVRQQVGTGPEVPFQSYFSGNTIQICPVGALTSTAYRFRSRAFDLKSAPTICELCSAGCELRTDHRSGKILRRYAGENGDVNEEWNCDKGRFAFRYVTADDRLRTPLVRGANGSLAPASWTDAMTAAAAGLAKAKAAGGVGVLAGGRLTVTDAYAYGKFARVALGTNDVDFRARVHSAEELDFLARRVVGVSPKTGGVTYRGLEAAKHVLLVALEPEEECPIVFLRLRKAARRHGTQVTAVAPYASYGLHKMGGVLIPAAPGAENAAVAALAGADDPAGLRTDGAVILVGERAAEVPGLLTAVGELADETGARLAWVPRRAGERGALDAGATPTLLPGGRAVTDAAARAQVENAWGTAIPETPGRDTAGILAAAAAGELGGLLIGGVELDDLPDPAAARRAVANAGFVVSLELRPSEVTDLADVVLPVAAAPEKAGAYLDWEGRVRPFNTALKWAGGLDDARVLDTLGVEMDVDLYTQTPKSATEDLARLGAYEIPRTRTASYPPTAATPAAADGALTLASWRLLLDGSRAEDGEPHLAGTRRPASARMSPATADRLGLADGALVALSGRAGSVTLPLVVTDMVDGVVWAPGRIAGASLAAQTGARAGDGVTVAAAAPGATAAVDPDVVASEAEGRIGSVVTGMGGSK